jgi:thioredoxin-like negative regulator of GroEL
VTDINGNFLIKINSPEDIISIKSVGYKNQDLLVKNNVNPTITLQPEVTALNEVVVSGFGSKKRSNVAGAVSKVSSEDIKDEKKEERELSLQIDSLNNILKADKQNSKVIKALIEKYLELQNKKEAVEKLNTLYIQTTDNEEKQVISEIIQLTKEEKYSRALKKLKKL